jgi:cytochrome b6-f complex iron-sulfur subunit
MNRRELLKSIAAGTTTLFIVPSLFTSCEDETVDPDDNNNPDELTIDLTEAKYSALGTAGGSVIEESIIIINTGDEFLALSSACTHSGCTVSYDHGTGNLPCPCHGSVFSTTGSVLNGPADSPLKKFEIAQEGDILTISL